MRRNVARPGKMPVVDWQAVADAVVARRRELGFDTRQAFIAASGLGARTVGDIETARRDSYAKDTIARLETALRWATGAVHAIGEGRTVPTADQSLAALSVDPRSLERYGDDLELMSILAGAQLNDIDAFRVVLRLRRRREEQHRELVAELREMIGQVKDGGGVG